MAFILKDRVKESTTTTGTGNISLGGALATFDTFQSYLSNGDTTFYAIAHTSSGVDEWEVGLGTWNTGNTLSRTTVLAGSNGTSAVTFSAGTKDVFMTYPASKAIVSGEDAAFANITVTGTVDGRDIAADGTKLDGVEASADVTDAVTVAAAGALMRSGGTMTGNLILNTDPNAALGAATKQYVDTIASAGIHYHAPVRVEHPSNLNATYNNGSSGVGATLTNAGTNAALVIDSVNMVLNDRVLVANQTDQTQNGVYTVTTVGNGSTAWVLTRSTDTDTAAPSDPDAFGKGDAFFIKEGSTNAGHLDVLSTAGTIVFGTTNIVFSEVAETTVYSGGTGITLTGTTFSIGQDVATSANVTFNQVTAAIIGNVTGNLTGDVTGNADTATALETARTIQLSGDVTGSASFDGSANINITAAVQDDSHAHVISNVDGLQSALDAKVPTSRTITAGNGLTGGGDLSANRTLTVGGGTGITVNANDIAIDSSYTGFDSRYVNVAGDTMTAPLTIDTNTSGMLTLSATNSSPWAIDLQRDDATNSRVFNAGGYWSFEHEPRYYNGGSHQKLFHDGYHPNADKWTTARTLSLTGDVTGSVSWDGSGNASLAATVANDSHNHNHSDGNFTVNGSLVVTSDINVGAQTGTWITSNVMSDAIGWNTNYGVYIGSDIGGTHYLRGNGTFTTGGSTYNLFHDGYHPNADTLTTARTINGVSFNGSANITIADSTKLPLAGGTMTGTLTGRDIQPAAGYHLRRLNHHSGHLEGSYNNVGTNSTKTNPIYSIGSNYNPNDDTLANFYGIGFSKNTASFMTGALDAGNSSGWGLYVASDGDARIFLNGTHGIINSTGEHYVNSQRVFHDGYHPNADKWTTARTLSLSGDASGSVSWDGSANATLSVTVANDSHTHNKLIAVDDRDMKPNTSGVGSGVKGIKAFFSSYGGMTGTANTDYQDVLVLDTYSDTSGGNANAITLDKSSSAMRIWNAAQGATSWGTPQRVFADNYHPNADKWTTARTLSLSGDASGSVSWDGSANATLSVTVADDSHNHTISNIDNLSVGSLTGMRLTTTSGYIEFGPANGSWGHIYTDRPNFYFNKELYVNNMRVYNTGYHPEADKWTTARTLSLSGDASGSVSWDGSANATLSVTVANDSHTHDGRYYTESEADGRYMKKDGDATLDMNNNNINYVNQVHFNDGVRFLDDGNDNYLRFRWNDTGVGGIKFYDGNETLHGYVYGNGQGHFGLLDKDAHWFVYTNGVTETQIRANNNAELFVYTSYVYAPGSFRAPIFYDSDNTAFYTNPATYSKLNALQLGSSTTHVNNSTYSLQIHDNNRQLVSLKYSSAASAYPWLVHDTYNSISAFIIHFNGVSDKFQFTQYGDGYAVNSFRAPIFYDSDDTAYYANPASTSVFNQINVTTLNSTSDIRFKSDLQKIDNAVDKLKTISGYTYMLKDHDDRKAGLIAQEVEAVLPEAVKGSEDKKLLDYQATIALLVEAVKEQSEEIAILKSRLEKLEN